MTERSSESGDLTPGDPLGGGGAPEPPRHESGLPGVPRGPESAQGAGYTSPAPPGAGGTVPAFQAAEPPMLGQYVLASWGSRVGAQLIDGLIIGVGALVLFLVFGAVFSVGFAASDETGIASVIVGLILWVVCVAIVALLYAPALMARTNGKTIGRSATNIRVVRTSGEPITFGFAMLREVAVKALLFGIAGSFTVGIANVLDVLWPLWDEENRALHDFIVQTRTVKD
ncbi:MAG TPA: RDD family protein [Solirubrobacteraceae bacterium]|nr:RDD family protein [Solirubrobacteraceae bacterium]